MRNQLTFAAMVWLFCSVANADSPPSSKDGHAAPAELAGLRERWLSAMEELRVPGLAVVAVRDGQVILNEALGYRDAERTQPVTSDTVFYIASCTKPFTAMAVVSLWEQGKVDLDSPVKRYLPRFELADAQLTETMTVRDLMCHSKGIAGGPIVWLDAYTGQITEDRYYHHLKDMKFAGRPEYTNVHFTLLGRVIEAVSGASWKNFLDERIFEPAGMTTATAYASEMYSGNAALPCVSIDGKVVNAQTRKTDRTMHAAGGMGASANDLARWLILNLNRGEIDGRRIITAESFDQMVAAQVKTEANYPIPRFERTAFGLAWGINTYRGERLIDHGGGYVGSSAWISFMPDKKIGVAAVANAGSRVTNMAGVDVYDRLLGGEPTDLLPKIGEMTRRFHTRMDEQRAKFGPNPAKAPNALSLPPASYAGSYSNPQMGTIEFRFQGGDLAAQFGDLPVSVGSTGPDNIELGYEDDSPSPGKFIIKDGKVIAVRLRLFEDRDEIAFRRD